MSSATSGFFFCGMMLLPVHRASGRERKRNSEHAQSPISSASRDRCIIVTAHAYRKSAAKSRSDTASTLFSHTPSIPSSRAVNARSSGNVEPASAPGEHLPVRQEVMGEEDRLRPLKVGIAGKDDPEQLFGPGDDGFLDLDEQPENLVDFLAQVQPEIG